MCCCEELGSKACKSILNVEGLFCSRDRATHVRAKARNLKANQHNSQSLEKLRVWVHFASYLARTSPGLRDVEGLGFRVQSLWLASGAAAHESSVWQRILLPLTLLGFAEYRLKDRVLGPCPERSLNPPSSLSLSLSLALSLPLSLSPSLSCIYIYIYTAHI